MKKIIGGDMSDLGNLLRTLGGMTGNETIAAMKRVAKEEALELTAEQIESKESFMESLEEMANPFAAKYATKQKPIENRPVRSTQKSSATGEKVLDPVEKLKDLAGQFQRRNPELKSATLIRLRGLIKEGQSKEEILKLVQDFFPDVTLADEVFDFLLEDTDSELKETILGAKQDLYAENERNIKAGRNVSEIARKAAEKGLGTPSSLRDMYRDITGNPRDSVTLFQELAQKYAFKDLNKVIAFLLHSLGSDLKSKGPSIARGLLHRLLTETRSLQAILGVYRFFRGRMALVQSLFIKNELELPPQVNFEALAKQFINLVGDRYPSADKILQLPGRFGLEKWLMAKIIFLNQFRDAIREVAVHQIYASLQHRDELYLAIIEALETLEELLEEEEERQEDDEEEDEEDEDQKNPHKKAS